MLGHRRLAILDLSPAGRQPMRNEDGTVLTVCNGEIYNYPELRAELIERGHQFSSHSDSEVIVHLYEEWGEGCVERLDGMFGLAIYDARRRRLLLARDPLGIKPVYYYADSDLLLFASEIRALLGCPPVPRRVNMAGVESYLAFGAVPWPQTAFAGILKVPPGHLLVVDVDGGAAPEVRPYWSVAHCEPLDGLTDEECGEKLRALLDRAVARMLVADVPVGLFLSGGVDSSAVCSFASDHGAQPISAYTVSVEGVQDTNEDAVAREVARSCRARHHTISVSWDDLIADLPLVAQQMEEPIADYTAVAVYHLCRFAKANGITVALVGEGGDELLAGYDRYRKLAAVDRHLWPWFQASPRWLRSVVAGLLGPVAGVYGREVLDGGVEGAGLFWGGATGFLSADRDKLLKRGRTACLSLYEAGVGRVVAEQRGRGADFLQIAGSVDLTYRLPDILLTRLDKLSMAWALECRVPFLDRSLVEFALGLRSGLKIRRGVTKYALRRLLPDRLPEAVRVGPKRGMLGTASAMLAGPLPEFARQQIKKSALLREIADETVMPDILARAFNGHDKLSCYRAWVLLSLALWHAAYFE